MKPIGNAALIALVLALTACAALAQGPRARVVTAIPWTGRGVWLKAELHTQTKFTDGAHTVDEVVAAAAKHGCDVVAITDHGDRKLKGATREYLDAIREARTSNPGINVIAGMEWDIPPGKGQEHANILFPSALETVDVLGAFKDRFDDTLREDGSPELALAGFAALAPKDRAALAPVVIVNHPSRRPASASAPAVTLEALKRAAPSILIGFEGGPGHQRGTPLGSYPPDTLVDRWDPLAARVDGGWDQWLRNGLDVWAAVATADFHNERDDFWPCEFAATWVYAPDRTGDGVIRALRAGSFFGEQGHIVQEAELQARIEGLVRPVSAGETAAAAAGTKATISLRMKVPPKDYVDRDNRIDIVDLIGVSATKTETLFSGPPGASDALSLAITVPDGGIVLRARGRRNIDGEAALMFYTNPIRITTPAR